MTQVSRIPLRKEIQNRVFEIFLISLAKVHKKEDVEIFIQDLLSPTEQMMLAKRLSIAYLLIRKYDQRSISKLLKVSLSTVNRVSLRLQLNGEGYEKVFRGISQEEKTNEFWQKLDDFINEIIPPKGRNWNNWQKQRWQERMSRQKPF